MRRRLSGSNGCRCRRTFDRRLSDARSAVESLFFELEEVQANAEAIAEVRNLQRLKQQAFVGEGAVEHVVVATTPAALKKIAAGVPTQP